MFCATSSLTRINTHKGSRTVAQPSLNYTHGERNEILTECFLVKSSFRISLHALRESFSLSFGFPPLGGGCGMKHTKSR
jgi:hypothetical protein